MAYNSMGKFDSARDETLFYLAMDWMEDGFGNVSDYGAYVQRISVSPEDLDNEELQRNVRVTDDEMDTSELVGHFLITENSQGFVYVEEYETEELRNADFDKLQNDYDNWEGHEDD